MMEQRGPMQLFWVIPGAALTVLISLSDISTGGEEARALVIVLGGILAISAMILPGVSGSFCLLILGLYQPTTEHIKSMVSRPNLDSLRFLALMAAGIVVGFIAFTRIMSFLLHRFRSATLAFLIGLILGSFWVLWPVKDYRAEPAYRLAESSGSVSASEEKPKVKIRIAKAKNILPGDERDQENYLVLVLACAAGVMGALGVNHLGKKNQAMEKA
jgi:putative membrane protein